MIELRENYFAIEVPEGATDFGFINGSLMCKLPDSKPGRYKWLYEADEQMTKIGGEWESICTSKEATEVVAEQIVQVVSNGKISGRPQYRRYDRDLVKDTPARSWTRDARHSLETLLASKGCDVNRNYLILKKG